jgi:hypothetical protein
MEPEAELLKLDYEQTLATYQQFAEIRFKLLAFVPALSAAAIALLTSAHVSGWTTSTLGATGFIVALGIVLYDQRNSQFYNGAISRAQHLEIQLRLRRFEDDTHFGLFGSRDDHPRRRLLGLPVRHGLGLGLVYSAVLGAWMFATLLPLAPNHAWIAALGATLVAAVFLAQFELNDNKLKRLQRELQRLRRT